MSVYQVLRNASKQVQEVCATLFWAQYIYAINQKLA